MSRRHSQTDLAEESLDLTGLANVVEDFLKRSLSLDEWQRLDDIADGGLDEEAVIRTFLETCTTDSVEDLQELDPAVPELAVPSGASPVTLEGRAVLVSLEPEDMSLLAAELMLLGLDMVDSVTPQEWMTRGAQPAADWLFLGESCVRVDMPQFRSRIAEQGRRQGQRSILVDQDLDLFDRWDDWPVTGVLTAPWTAETLHACLAACRDNPSC